MIRQNDEEQHRQIAERLSDVERVQAVLKTAAQRAVQEHTRAGRPIAVWRGNQVVWEAAKATEGGAPE